MDRQTALDQLAADTHHIAEGQSFVADYFSEADAIGIARLFYAVYGRGYPIDTYYLPQRLIEGNQRGTIQSVVARTPAGDVVAHVALYCSSPPNPGLYEYGVGLTLPAYRNTLAFFRASQLLMRRIGVGAVDGCFGEAVCNHVITQKLSRQLKFLETALEPALIPADAYEAERSASGRVGCIVSSRIARDFPQRLFLPARYAKEIEWILDGLSLSREPKIATATPTLKESAIEITRYAFAGVTRATLTAAGSNLETILQALEGQLRVENYAMLQCFVNLGDAACGEAIECLRGRGFSLGGFLPAWFGSDGLLMQKHWCDPGFDSMQILTERGRRLFEMVKADCLSGDYPNSHEKRDAQTNLSKPKIGL